jgi:formylmethanofuran dehydrogenase subunit E
MEANRLDLRACLDEAKEFHGDVCAGIVLGTRLALLGLDAIGIHDPKDKDRKDLIVYVETDRCATDAILSVTGCHPGKRSMKILDYGKMAATFINLKTGKAVRVVVRSKGQPGDIRTRETMDREPPIDLEEYVVMPADQLFMLQDVTVQLRPEDMPGKPLQISVCSVCGEQIMDKREVVRDGQILCKPCSGGATYYKVASPPRPATAG